VQRGNVQSFMKEIPNWIQANDFHREKKLVFTFDWLIVAMEAKELSCNLFIFVWFFMYKDKKQIFGL